MATVVTARRAALAFASNARPALASAATSVHHVCGSTNNSNNGTVLSRRSYHLGSPLTMPVKIIEVCFTNLFCCVSF